jgi:hypothetical protein
MKKRSLFFIAFLILCLPSAEIPELISISDDVSNDFVVTESTTRLSQHEVDCEKSAQSKEGPVLLRAYTDFALLFPLSSSQFRGRSLLLFISVQKK